jgi:hypothetical protein
MPHQQHMVRLFEQIGQFAGIGIALREANAYEHRTHPFQKHSQVAATHVVVLPSAAALSLGGSAVEASS